MHGQFAQRPQQDLKGPPEKHLNGSKMSFVAVVLLLHLLLPSLHCSPAVKESDAFFDYFADEEDSGWDGYDMEFPADLQGDDQEKDDGFEEYDSCHWPPCFNEPGERDSIQDILNDPPPSPEPVLHEEDAEAKDESESGEQEALPTPGPSVEVEDDVEVADTIKGSVEKPPCSGEPVIVYQSLPPNGVIVASVVFFVIVVALFYYVPRCYKIRYKNLAQSNGEAARPGEKALHEKLVDKSRSLSVPEIRFREEV